MVPSTTAGDRWRDVMPVTLAVVLGMAVGLLGRNLPITVAAALLASPDVGPCPMQQVAHCVLRDLPEVLARMVVLGVVVIAIDVVLALSGGVLVVLGSLRVRQAHRPRWTGLILLGAGTALVVPGLWLLGLAGVFWLSG